MNAYNLLRHVCVHVMVLVTVCYMLCVVWCAVAEGGKGEEEEATSNKDEEEVQEEEEESKTEEPESTKHGEGHTVGIKSAVFVLKEKLLLWIYGSSVIKTDRPFFEVNERASGCRVAESTKHDEGHTGGGGAYK